MTNRLLQVSFRWMKTVPDVPQLEKTMLGVSDDWFRLTLDVWFVWTSLNPVQVYTGLSRAITNEDGVVVTIIDTAQRPFVFGWAPQIFWDWMGRKLGMPALDAKDILSSS